MNPKRLLQLITAGTLAGAATFTHAAAPPFLTRPAAFDVALKQFTQQDTVKPGEAAAALLRSAQVACPSNVELAQIDPSKLRYALLGGNWLARRVSEKSVLADAAQWQVKTFLANVEKGTGVVNGLNMYAQGLQCQIGASEVAWLVHQVDLLGAEQFRQGKSRMTLYSIPELPPFKAPLRPKAEASKPAYLGWFPSYLKAKPNSDTRFLYSAEGLEGVFAGLTAEGSVLDEEVADWMCWQKGHPLKQLERASRGIASGVTEYVGDYICDSADRVDQDEDREVATVAKLYDSHGASLQVSMQSRYMFTAALKFGSLNREQAYALVRWALQSGASVAQGACGKGMYMIPRSVEVWALKDDASRDAVVTLETACGRRGR